MASEQDRHASELARGIVGRGNHQDQEYVAVVYRADDGRLQATELFTSGHYDRAPLGQAIKAAGGADKVVAVVHNHPSRLADSAPDVDVALFNNRMPSDNDWKFARIAFGDRQDVSYYVLGPDSQLRRYEYADSAAWDRANEPPRMGRPYRQPELGPAIPLDLPPPERPPVQPSGRDAPAALNAPSVAALSDVDPTGKAPEQRAPHPLLAQAESAVRRLDASLSKPFDAQSACMAASLACLAKERGFDRIDHALLSIQSEQTRAGENVFIVQGDPNDPAKRRAHMKTQDAIAVPVEESVGRLAALEQASPQRAQDPKIEELQREQSPRRTGI